MAPTTYTLKRGNNIWNLAEGLYGADYRAAIPGNNTNAKVNYLIKLNNIKDTRKMPVGYVVRLNESGTSAAPSSSSAPAVDRTRCVVTRIGLQAENDTDGKNRAVYADWTWCRASEKQTKNYKYRWTQYINGKWSVGTEGETTSYEDIYCYSTWTADEKATKVRFSVFPVSDTYTKVVNKKEETYKYFTDAKWSVEKEYDFTNNPPITPAAPSIEINQETLMLTASISNIVASELDAVSVKFNIIRDNSASIAFSEPPVKINTTSNYVAWQYKVESGHTYTVRCCSVNSKGKTSGWSDFSEPDGTKPSAPTGLSVRRDTHVDEKNGTKTYSVFLSWKPVNNATNYKVEYTNVKSNFDTAGTSIQSQTTEDSTPSIRIGINAGDLGYTYYFRAKAVNEEGESDPTGIVELPIGIPPGPPSTWSTSDSAFAGETMELNWIHNPNDNSKQTYAQISFNFNDAKDSAGKFVWNDLEVMVNSTDVNDTDPVTKDYTYGTAVSYKGDLYFKMDTNRADLKNTKIRWRVRTAGVTDITINDSWSVERTIYIYEKPTLGLSMTSDLAGTGALIETLTSFPFYVRAKDSLTDYTIQRPIGYHVQIISNEYYVTVDDVGRTKIVNPGDAVYSKYFDTSGILIVEMSADNLDLESSISYTMTCTADMSTGLSISSSHEFTVRWVDIEYLINADIVVDNDSYVATITPYCRESIPVTVGEGEDAYTTYEEGDLVENVTLSVYRREYDGTYKEIASGVPNNGTAVTDPHPALDYARYRFTAKDVNTGALSFWDMPGRQVNGGAVVIQWSEEWSTFDVGESTETEGPSWSGSLLKLPYNIKVTDKRGTEVSLVEYAGRKHPVSYYGTQVGESSQWNMEIPKNDKDTIYALRRLSVWSGDAYVREPSGMGYWANVVVSFSQSYNEVTIPVTLDITRVEGGV